MKTGKNQEKSCNTGFMMVSLLCGGMLFASGCSKENKNVFGKIAKVIKATEKQNADAEPGDLKFSGTLAAPIASIDSIDAIDSLVSIASSSSVASLVSIASSGSVASLVSIASSDSGCLSYLRCLRCLRGSDSLDSLVSGELRGVFQLSPLESLASRGLAAPLGRSVSSVSRESGISLAALGESSRESEVSLAVSGEASRDSGFLSENLEDLEVFLSSVLRDLLSP